MPLVTEVGFGPGDVVLDGDPAASPSKRCTAPSFRSMSCGQTVWHRSRPRPRPHSVRRDPVTFCKGAQQPPLRRTSIVAKRSPISATAELLLIFGHHERGRNKLETMNTLQMFMTSVMFWLYHILTTLLLYDYVESGGIDRCRQIVNLAKV